MQQPQTPPRRYPRAKIGFEISVQVEHRGTSTRADGLLTVLGAGGAFLELGRDYPVGSMLRLRFRFPSAEEEITCTAIVRNGLVRTVDHGTDRGIAAKLGDCYLTPS